MRIFLFTLSFYFIAAHYLVAQLCGGVTPVTTISVDISGWQARGVLGHPDNTDTIICGFPVFANIIGLEWENMLYNTIGDTWCYDVILDLNGELIIYVENGGDFPGPCGPFGGGSPTILQLAGLEMTADNSGCITMEPYLDYITDDVGADYVSGIVTYTACPQGISLPVVMSHLSVSLVGQTHLIVWTTASENNNKGWEIQRSRKGFQWETIGWEYGAGNSNRFINYSFIDPSPMSGLNFYRLRQFDYDGKESFSDVKFLLFQTEDVSIYPNPARDKIFVHSKTDEVQYELMDINGKLLIKGKSSDGGINISGLSEGSYFIRIENEGVISWHRMLKVE